MVLIGAREFQVFRVNCEWKELVWPWSPVLLTWEKSGVEGRRPMNGRAVKLNRSREASEDPVWPGGIYRHFVQRLHPFHPILFARAKNRSLELRQFEEIRNSRRNRERESRSSSILRFARSWTRIEGIRYRVDTANAFYKIFKPRQRADMYR